MKRKIICIGIVSILMITGLSAIASASQIEKKSENIREFDVELWVDALPNDNLHRYIEMSSAFVRIHKKNTDGDVEQEQVLTFVESRMLNDEPTFTYNIYRCNIDLNQLEQGFTYELKASAQGYSEAEVALAYEYFHNNQTTRLDIQKRSLSRPVNSLMSRFLGNSPLLNLISQMLGL